MQHATAAVISGEGAPFELREVLLDDPRPGEVLVRIAATGMCHTDLAVRAGRTPFPLPAVLGHEGAGTVMEVGDGVTRVTPGDRVLLSFDSCGTCLPCATGRPVQCVHWPALNLLGGQRLDGSPTVRGTDGAALHGHFFGQSSFATQALASERSVVEVVGDTPLEVLAPLRCGVQTGAGAVLDVLRPHPGSTVMVFGAGAVGLSAVLAARLTPAVRIVDVQPARLELARELDATDTIDARSDDPVAAVRDLTGDGAHYALESSGSTAVLRQAVDALAVDGTVAVVGAPAFGSEVALDVPRMLLRNPRIIGVNQGASVPQQFLPALVALHERGRLPFDRLTTAFTFDRIEDAAQAALSGEAIKPVMVLP